VQHFKVSIRLFTKQEEDKFTDSKQNYLASAWLRRGQVGTQLAT